MRDRPAPARSPLRRDAGFTLVELMVSATVLGLATIGAFAMIGVGRSLDTDETLRRQAFQFATSELESPAYSVYYTNFAAIQGASRQVDLKRAGGQTLTATLSVVVTASNANLRNVLANDPTNPNPNPATLPVPWKSVEAKVKWTADKDDSVVVVKWIADAQ